MLIVDEASDMKWSIFMKKKKDLPKELLGFLENLYYEGKVVKYVRLDNAGENKKFQELAKKQKYSSSNLLHRVLPSRTVS